MSFPTVQHIKFAACPVCGAKLVSAQVSNQHSNGHWNERVEFQCRCVYEFSPNFMAVDLKQQCRDAHELYLKAVAK